MSVAQRRASDFTAAVVALATVVVATFVLERYAQPRDFAAFGYVGSLIGWAAARNVGYVLVPLLVGVVLGYSPSELYLGRAAERGWGKFFLLFFAVFLLLAWVLARTTDLSSVYPIARGVAQDPRLLSTWWPIYALALFPIEFCFRGFLLVVLRPTFGPLTIAVATIPYVLTHHYLPEIVGAVVTGLVFGYLAEKRRSLWMGYWTHLGIAFSLDLFGLVGLYGHS